MITKSAVQMDKLVQLQNAGLYRSKRWLIRGVDFTVSKGEIVTLIGPNGSGKSTSAKIAIGLIKPTEGSVSTRDKLRIGYVPQKLSIDWTMPLTVKRLMSLTQKLSPAEAQDALEMTGIAHLQNSQIQNLSGGEFQRALLARAIARKPDLLVLDEPVQGVDFNGQIALYALIKKYRDTSGCGVLMISHDLHVVMADTDTVICLNGHVCCRGTPQVVSNSSEYMKLFGATAANGLAVYNHHHDHTHLPDGRVQHADGSITAHCHPDDGHHKIDGDAHAAHDHSNCGHSHDSAHHHDINKVDICTTKVGGTDHKHA